MNTSISLIRTTLLDCVQNENDPAPINELFTSIPGSYELTKHYITPPNSPPDAEPIYDHYTLTCLFGCEIIAEHILSILPTVSISNNLPTGFTCEKTTPASINISRYVTYTIRTAANTIQQINTALLTCVQNADSDPASINTLLALLTGQYTLTKHYTNMLTYDHYTLTCLADNEATAQIADQLVAGITDTGLIISKTTANNIITYTIRTVANTIQYINTELLACVQNESDPTTVNTLLALLAGQYTLTKHYTDLLTYDHYTLTCHTDNETTADQLTTGLIVSKNTTDNIITYTIRTIADTIQRINTALLACVQNDTDSDPTTVNTLLALLTGQYTLTKHYTNMPTEETPDAVPIYDHYTLTCNADNETTADQLTAGLTVSKETADNIITYTIQ